MISVPKQRTKTSTAERWHTKFLALLPAIRRQARIAFHHEPSERREEMWAMNLNTCHVWAEDSDVVTGLREGVAMGVPVFLRGRLDELGVQSDDWAPWAED